MINKRLLMRRVINKTTKKPWLTHALEASCKTKHKFYKLLIATKYPKNEYIVYRNKLTKLLRVIKANHFNSITNDNPKNFKQAWRANNELADRNYNVAVPQE